ncbi:MAG TPA: hypothetical protein VM620_06625 [Hyphomicrobium sp.]|jgi:hypothetical protein|nr:hypothetical protein [Hyphomicrobium sp.]
MRVSKAVMAGRVGLLAVGLLGGLAAAHAQQTPEPPAAADKAAAADDGSNSDDVKQIKLTEDQVKHFIAAQPDLSAVASKVQAAGDNPDPALQAELEGIATKHGFSNFAELDDVAANISIVMAGLDAKTGNFVDPVEALKKERDDVEKDSSIPDTDKKQLMDELTEAISTTPKLQYKENVDIVKAHKAEIEKALQ